MKKITTSALIRALVDVGYHVIDDFLAENDYHALCEQIQTLVQAQAFRPAKIGNTTNTTHQPLVRTDNICWLNGSIHSTALSTFYDAIDDIKRTLNQVLFVGLVEFEAHFSVYYPGQFYKKHVDQFKDNKDRRISCVYYLNKAWQPKDGGELSIYNSEQEFMIKLSPLGNRLVCFNSELLHEVHTAQDVRYSITGWLKSRALSR